MDVVKQSAYRGATVPHRRLAGDSPESGQLAIQAPRGRMVSPWLSNLTKDANSVKVRGVEGAAGGRACASTPTQLTGIFELDEHGTQATPASNAPCG